MKTYTLADVIQFVDKCSDIINFGTAEDVVSCVRIREPEGILSLQFTTSYKDFLKNYKGREIRGEEILSIYIEVLGIILLMILSLNRYKKWLRKITTAHCE